MFGTKRMLYFREALHDNYLVFVPPARALCIDQIRRAIVESKMWGGFRLRLPAGEYHTLFADESSTDPEVIAEHDGARGPRDDERFPQDVPGYSDCDYPP